MYTLLTRAIHSHCADNVYNTVDSVVQWQYINRLLKAKETEWHRRKKGVFNSDRNVCMHGIVFGIREAKDVNKL